MIIPIPEKILSLEDLHPNFINFTDRKSPYKSFSNFENIQYFIYDQEFNIPHYHVEGYYQSMKCADKNDRILFIDLTAAQSKRLGQKIKIRKDWDQIKQTVMFQSLLQKFSKNLELAELLKSTENQQLVEGNYWGDSYWGFDLKKNIGCNILGIQLQKVREILIENQNSWNILPVTGLISTIINKQF